MIPLAALIQDVYGKPIELGSRATCLAFVTVDCPISNGYQPYLARLERQYRGKGVTFVQVHVDPSVSVSGIKAHASEYKVKWRVAGDPQHTIVKRFGATVTPEVVVLNATGRVAYQGRIDDTFPALGKRRTPTSFDFADALASVVAGRLPAVAKTTAIGCVIEP